MSEQLQAHIQNLHDILEGQPVDECTAASLKQITTEIEIALAQADGTIPENAYNEALEQEAVRFTEDHPAIAQIIRQIMNTLDNIGI
ncbi:DUF4404 family protein [Sansalvadorimonas sp. 2012CJ34-2]|uniref:DUF4404 family protein n=1 Tax=Parendozoicomonas callyspongiae TaxID=2942213 RepID=A0ABT0PAI8_9GAMM|nr:DUF4404 family protein [Sansalvadorimonas sp. 2012CJ34-2]MCL6268400.1 DUF4404 family protein [Sansalvadorimonas sp. 2012CJ34-2]